MASVPPSDLVINGLDLTTVFARYISGPKASPTGILINGQDLCNVFAPYIIGLKANPTGIYVGGGRIDICNIFLPINAVIPVAPTNLTVSSVTNSTASLSFNTVAGAISYLATTTTGITGASTSTPLIIQGLAVGTLYTVSLRTINPWGMSNPTNSINVTTFPVLPTMTTTISDVSMTIVYTTFPTLTYYTATVTPTLGGSSTIYTSSTGSFSITSLNPFTGYKVVYLTSNVAGQSIPSIVNYTTAPSPPTNLSLSNITSSSASLSFTTVVGATSYLVSAVLNGITTSTASGTSSPINISGIAPANTYSININSIYGIAYSNASSINLTTQPNPPTNLSVTNTTYNSITINFSTATGATSYVATAVPIPSGTTVTSASTSFPITISGLISVTTYNITLISKNNSGNSISSNSVSGTTVDYINISGLSYTKSSNGSYNNIYSFTGGTGTITFPSSIIIKVLIVAGGGGGSYGYRGSPTVHGGGGGAGGVGYGDLNVVMNTAYTLTIGNGGYADASNPPLRGANSSIIGTSINETAYGGGGAGGTDSNPISGGGINSNGGSGGGVGANRSYGTATRGSGTKLTYLGNGGFNGGGGAAAGSGSGAGGNGYTWPINNITVGGGGGSGGGYNGGSGGGGNGSTNYPNWGNPGSANTGGGGGGGCYGSSGGNGSGGGTGGSGIIVIAFNI